MKNYVLKAAAICAGCLSVAVVWSEVTFFNKSPVLSLFAQFLNLAKRNYDYFTIEVKICIYYFAQYVHIMYVLCTYYDLSCWFSGTVHLDHRVSLLLRLLDSFEDTSIESLLFGTSSSNKWVQSDIQWYDAVSLNSAYVSQFPRTYSHGFPYHQNSYPGNALYTSNVI